MTLTKPFYVSTPIYYVNDVPHIGHAYSTILADILARHHALRGADTFLLTGTDEHGQKIEQAASARGSTPAAYTDTVSEAFRQLWDRLGIRYDHFIRTTDASHIAGVQKAFAMMMAKGDIYKGEYTGHYCVSCETYVTDTQIRPDHLCTDCGKPLQTVQEESYFFRLSAYQDRLLDWYRQQPACIRPLSRRNEVLSFVSSGLEDLSITRTGFTWGIPLPASVDDPQHVVYVWLDALLNYLTALGYGSDEARMNAWPADYHIIGKDILRFHAVFWPAFLMSLELPLPKTIAAHGWWTINGAKMSKSKGNVVDPQTVVDRYSLDGLRYFLAREIPFGEDGDFSEKALVGRVNNDLGNDLGNLLNRFIGMAFKYFDGAVRPGLCIMPYRESLREIQFIVDGLDRTMEVLQTNQYLASVWSIIFMGNRVIHAEEPWLKMQDGREAEVQALLGFLAQLLAKVAFLLHPIIPDATVKIGEALGIRMDAASFRAYVLERRLLPDFIVTKVPPLFPRLPMPE